jgi:hypothetical protein
MPKVETLQEFITQAIICDNWLLEMRQEKRFGWGNTNHTMISTSSTSEENESGSKPMQIGELDISHYHKGKITDVVKKGYAFIVAVQSTSY